MAASEDREQGSVVGTRSDGRLAYLDGLRALAALYVVLTHAVLVAAPTHVDGHSEGARPSWLPPGHFAVAVFIVLSGFCLTLPVVRADGKLVGGARAFYRRRARRILPPYYAALAFTLLLIWTLIGADTGTFWDFSVPIRLAGYVGNALLLQDIVGYWQVSVPFWSIAVEAQIYLLFPLLLLCWRRLGARATVLGAVLLSYAAMIATYKAGRLGPLFFPGLTVHFVGLFVIGMAAAWLATCSAMPWIDLRRRTPWTFLALGFALCGAILAYGSRNNLDVATPIVELPLGLAVASLLVATARPQRSRRLRALLSWRPFAFIGMFSYSVYLVHAPLLQATWQYGLRPFHLDAVSTFMLLVAIGLPLVLTGAYLFFRVCERPFIKGRRRRGIRLTGRIPAALTRMPHAPQPAAPLMTEPPAASELA